MQEALADQREKVSQALTQARQTVEQATTSAEQHAQQRIDEIQVWLITFFQTNK